MGDDSNVTVLVGVYDDIFIAMQDFEQLRRLHDDGQLGNYEAALVKKEPSGMVVVSDVDTSKAKKGGAAGAVAGGVVGVVFPPSLVGAALVGAGAGAAMGGRGRPLKRGDLKELGGLLKEGRTGIVVVTDEVSPMAEGSALGQAARRWHGPVPADAAAIKQAIEAVAVAEHAATVG